MIMTEEEMDEQIELMQEVTLEEMLYQYGDDGKWLYEQGRADAEVEHKEMCETCIHKVSAEDIKQIRNDAIEEFETRILGNCASMLKDGERVIVIRQNIFQFISEQMQKGGRQ